MKFKMNLFTINYLILIEIGVLRWTNVCASKVLPAAVKISCPHFSHSDHRRDNESFPSEENKEVGYNDDGGAWQSIRVPSSVAASTGDHAYKLPFQPHRQLPYGNHGSHQHPPHLFPSFPPLEYSESLKISRPMEEGPKVAIDFDESAMTNRGENKYKFPNRGKGRVQKRKKHLDSKRAGAIKSWRTIPIMCSGSHIITEPIVSPSQPLVSQQPVESPFSHPNEPDIFKSSNHKLFPNLLRVKKVCIKNRCKNVIFAHRPVTGPHTQGSLRKTKKNCPLEGNQGAKNSTETQQQNPITPNAPPAINILPSVLENNHLHREMDTGDELSPANSTPTEHNSSKTVHITAADSSASPQSLRVYSVAKFPAIKKVNVKKPMRKTRKPKKKKIILVKAKEKPPAEEYDEQVLQSAIRYINALTSSHFGEPPPSKLQSNNQYRQPENPANVSNYSKENKEFRYDNATANIGRFENDSREWKPVLGREPTPEDQTQWLPVPSFLKTHLETHFSNTWNFGAENEAGATSPQSPDDEDRATNHARENPIPEIIPGIPAQRETHPTEKSKTPLQNTTPFHLTLIDRYVEQKVKETINREREKELEEGKTSARYKRKASLTSAEDGYNEETDGRLKGRIARSDPDGRHLNLPENSEKFKLNGTKRPLPRLRGLDFLTRYEKKKSKPHQKLSDFWTVSNTNQNPDKGVAFDGKFIPDPKTKLHKNPPRQTNKSLKQSQKSSTDTITSHFSQTQQKGFSLGKPLKDAPELRIIVTEAPVPKTTAVPDVIIKVKPNKYRISLREKPIKTSRPTPTPANDKPKLPEPTADNFNYQKEERPSSQATTAADNSSIEKHSQTDQNTLVPSHPPKSNWIPRDRGKTVIIVQDPEQVVSPRPYYRDFRPNFTGINEAPENPTTTENIPTPRHKIPHYNAIERTHGPAKNLEHDVPGLLPTTPSFHGYLTPSRNPIQSEQPQENAHEENLPHKGPQYSSISRNRQSSRNKTSEEVTSARPTYGEFEKTFAATEADKADDTHKPGRTPGNGENDTLATSDDSNQTEDGSLPYDDGPVLYYIVNEKTGRGRHLALARLRSESPFWRLLTTLRAMLLDVLEEPCTTQPVLMLLSVMNVHESSGRPAPDSAGLVPQPPGLAYGGIPYGSVSGQLSLYFGDYEPLVSTTSPKDSLIDSLQLL